MIRPPTALSYPGAVVSDVTSMIDDVSNTLAVLHKFAHACSRSLILILSTAGMLREGEGL